MVAVEQDGRNLLKMVDVVVVHQDPVLEMKVLLFNQQLHKLLDLVVVVLLHMDLLVAMYRQAPDLWVAEVVEPVVWVMTVGPPPVTVVLERNSLIIPETKLVYLS